MKIGSLYSKEGDRAAKKPWDAATLILVRDRHDGAYEVFLMQRHRNQAFMGGASVFPGGRLNDADMDPELASFTAGLSASAAPRLLQEPDISEAKALGLFMAAIRETFEEAGVLFARDSSGRPVDLTDPETAARFASYRLDLSEERLALAELARCENIRYAPDLLIPYSHWITPEREPRRFDTRFFLARLPEGQAPTHDRTELSDSRWRTPAAALTDHAAGRIVLMPPTLKTIEELHACSSIVDLFTAASARQIRIILPEPFRTADGFGVLLPNDSEYSCAAYKQTPRSGETSRIVMKDGIWKTFSV